MLKSNLNEKKGKEVKNWATRSLSKCSINKKCSWNIKVIFSIWQLWNWTQDICIYSKNKLNKLEAEGTFSQLNHTTSLVLPIENLMDKTNTNYYQTLRLSTLQKDSIPRNSAASFGKFITTWVIARVFSLTKILSMNLLPSMLKIYKINEITKLWHHISLDKWIQETKSWI